jgi:hypothetical protein
VSLTPRVGPSAAVDVVMADDDVSNEQCFNQLEDDNLSVHDESDVHIREGDIDESDIDDNI